MHHISGSTYPALAILPRRAIMLAVGWSCCLEGPGAHCTCCGLLSRRDWRAHLSRGSTWN